MIDFFGKKRKKKEENELHIKTTGIVINVNPQMNREGMKKSNILLNGVINYMVIFSTLMLIITAFGVKVNLIAFMLFLFCFCLFIASFYEYTFLKIGGYILIIIMFIYGINTYHSAIRGGFGTFANAFMEVLEETLDLPIERRYQEFTSNKVFAVTLCTIFVGGSLALILNMAITEAKGFALTFLITFPIAQMGIYFEREINVIYFIIYIASMIALMLLRSSVHYKSETRKEYGYHIIERKDVKRYEYVNDGRNSVEILLFLLVSIVLSASLIVGVISMFTDVSKKKPLSAQVGQWKEGTQDFVKKTALVGFWGMLNKNGSGTGGIGRNRLGNVKYVKMDYQTDLSVETKVVEDEETIYLRAYTGTYYKNNSWKYISEYDREGFKELSHYVRYPILLNSLNCNILSNDVNHTISGPVKEIKIYNLDGNEKFLYLNNNTMDIYRYCDKIINDDEWIGGIPQGKGIKAYYRPLKNMKSTELAEKALELKQNNSYDNCYEYEKKYREYVYNTYLHIPKKNKKSIDKFIDKYGLDKSSGLDNIEKLQEVFQENFTYTLMPGITPDNKDFVNYFLDETQKGYCSYFASAAVLIYRRLGIPARYVGGYAVSTTDSDYMYKMNNKDENLYQIDVNDSCAHAWVEVYINNLGWVVADVTPSTDSTNVEEETEVGIMGMLANTIFSPNTANAIKNTTIGIAYIAIGGVVVLIGIVLVTGIFIRRKRKNNININDNIRYAKAILNMYGVKWDNKTIFSDIKSYLEAIEKMDEQDIEQFVYIIEKDKYSRNGTSLEEKRKFHEYVCIIGEDVYASLSWIKKIKFIYIKNLIK